MQPNEPQATATPTKGPGDQLRQARLALKLGPDDVAQILHLSPKQIIALENDDFAHLPGPTYVRGYLRGYAQLLGIPPEGVLAAYNGLQVAAPQVDLTKLAPEPQIDSEHQVVRWATWGVLVVVFGLAAIWWLGRDDTTPRPTPMAVGRPADLSVPVTPGETAVDADNKTVATAPAPAGTPAPTTPADGKTAKPPVPILAPGLPAAGLKVTVTAPAATASPVASTNPVPAGPRQRLVLVASQDSWADVRDAQQNKLLYETLRPGQTVTVEGLAPLNVFLGNADGVKLEYNGKPFDVAPHKHGVFARFTLNAPAPESANVPRR
jgi:cytoskeleton protein RodZ